MQAKTGMAALAAMVLSSAPIQPGARAAEVSSEDLLNAQENAAEWLMYGRDYRNQRFSPLDQITPENVGELRPVWAFSTGGQLAGLEATPLMSDGVLYLSGDYSRVFAVDARNGTALWTFEPQYEEGLEAMLCCGPVNRGVALYEGLVFVNTLDARLFALDAKDGSVVWEQTLGDWRAAVTATGAPLVVKDMVITGIAGAEYGVRGYLKAYDARTGEERWTTYTIPGQGEPGNDTWPADRWQTGGATTWQTGTYEPESETLYWGTGNPGPWNADLRPGDNRWSSSLIALDVDDGAFKWGFQYTPHDAWDYDGKNAPILVDLELEGGPVKALIQSNRNGFFYVLEATTGEFIYAVPTIEGINWTSGLDPETGRPTVNEEMVPRAGGGPVEPIVPGLEGGTNWFPMAWNPDLKTVYFATNHWAMSLEAWPAEEVVYTAGGAYMGADYQMLRLEDTIGYVKAFNPETREYLWQVESPLPLFAGMLATGSGLVFTGDQLGHALALDAGTGEKLWSFQTGSGINASPITYQLDGTQYLALLSGLGGDPSFYFSGPKGGMLWVFALESKVAEADGMNPVPIPGALPRYEAK